MAQYWRKRPITHAVEVLTLQDLQGWVDTLPPEALSPTLENSDWQYTLSGFVAEETPEGFRLTYILKDIDNRTAQYVLNGTYGQFVLIQGGPIGTMGADHFRAWYEPVI